MINSKLITQGVEKLLTASLYPDYIVERNPVRPEEPSKAVDADKGWIGIYRGSKNYEPKTTGNQPFLCAVDTIVEVQVASISSKEEAEDLLCDAENEVIAVLRTDKSLNGTVDMTNGYSVEYMQHKTNAAYFQSALITIHSEAKTG